MLKKFAVTFVALMLLTGCTPEKGGKPPSGVNPPPPAAAVPFVPGGATLVVETYDLKTMQIIPANERDYPLKVVISVFNHDGEEAELFPEHILVTHNPWNHTVEWPQVDQFDRAEADVIVPHGLVKGVGVSCRWQDLRGVPYANTSELAVRGGAPGGADGMQCILLKSTISK